MKTSIKNPTSRKALNRGWKPIRYRTEAGPVRNGWEVSRDEKTIVVHLVGEATARKLPIAESQFIVTVAP